MTSEDDRSELALVDALRALLRALTPDDVFQAVIATVRALGADVAPASTVETEEGRLALDISFGLTNPLVPVGPPAALQAIGPILTPLIEDGNVALARIRRERHFADSADMDPLTTLPNRRLAMRALEQLRPQDTVVTLAIERLEELNADAGHDAGDLVLRKFADALRLTSKSSDLCARMSGAEFMLLCRDLDEPGAKGVLDRLHVAWEGSRPYPVVFAAGVCAVEDRRPTEALVRAGRALLAERSNGQGRAPDAA
jgi:diguanylate cyclase (GGDEF)-like protein